MSRTLEQLQEELFKLRRERSAITFEKGMVAEDSKDLRENGVYQIMEEQENMVTGKIMNITREIEKMTRKPSKKPIRKTEKKEEPLKKQKWY